MTISPLAGHRPPHTMLASIPGLVSAYYTEQPDPENPLQLVSFGTSGHRGSSLKGSFNEAHILAVSQAIAEFRTGKGINGPLFVGKDTHALSEPAFRTAVEVFAANGVETVVQEGGGYTPTPVISHAILGWNRDRTSGLADGVVITPSHNPPEDGGFKYNPPSGGPADPEMTDRIQARANEILRSGGKGVRRIPFSSAMKSDTVRAMDYIAPYVNDLGAILDLQAIARSGVSIGADPMGGSGVAYWDVIASRYGLKLEVVNPAVDPTFSFMSVDWDGKIRMDCSSPYAMAGLVQLKDRYDIAFGNDTDFDRHGIVVPDRGLLAPNGYLAVAVDYLFTHRPAGGRTRPWERPSYQARSSTGSPGRWDGNAWRFLSASNGSWKDCSTAPWASGARKAPGRPSSGRTGRRGPPTRTESSSPSSRRKSWRLPESTPEYGMTGSRRDSAFPTMQGSMPPPGLSGESCSRSLPPRLRRETPWPASPFSPS